MGDQRDELERIADALERIAPAIPKHVDWSAGEAFVWDGRSARTATLSNGAALNVLRGVDEQKRAVCDNLARLAKGAAAHDMLLWGARGMGKSALIRAAAREIQGGNPGACKLIQIAPNAMNSIASLIELLADQDGACLLFIDDLGFDEGNAQDNLALRSVLDGGVITRPPHIRLAVTSNRRAIVARNGDTAGVLHERDERDNALALADRFGLTLAFHPCDQPTYLDILRAYTDPLKLPFDEAEANAFAIARGGRSGRIAYQYATELAGRAGLTL